MTVKEQLGVAKKLEKMADEIRDRLGVVVEVKKPESEIGTEYRSKVQELLLEKIIKDIYPKGVQGKPITADVMCRAILHCALAHWDKLEPYYRADLNYANNEGLDLKDLWAEKQRQHIFSRKRKSRAK